MSELDFYKGHWSAIPHALATLTSGNAFLLLFNIIRNSKTSVPHAPIKLSKNKLAAAMNVSRNTVDKCIKELVQLNILHVIESRGNATLFTINWDEVEIIHTTSSIVNDFGWKQMRKICNNKPYSNVDEATCSKIEQVYKRTYMIDSTTCSKTEQVDTELAQFLSKLDNATNLTCSEIEQVIDILVQKLSKLVYTCSEIEQAKAMLAQKLLFAGLSTCSKTEQVTPQTCSKTEHSIDIYIDKEKDDGELRSPIKGGEKKEKVLKWFENRDLSFPVLSSNDFNSIINLPDFADEDFDKAVRQVWGYLQYDDSPDGFENNFIPAELFMDFLFRAWNDLKELDEDFFLSEQDMKNIFGFDISERDGELVCYVTPSKIHDITAPVEIVSRPTRRRDANDRIQRMLFVEAVTDIAKQDEKLLSDSEYIVWQIIKTVEKNKANGIPRADEITKLQFNDFIQIWSEETSIPVKDIQSLLKDLPQKGKVTLSALQLLPDNFFQYNHEHDDTNNVEELFNKKLEEYKNDDDNVE